MARRKRETWPVLPFDNLDYELTANDLGQLERILKRSRDPAARAMHQKIRRVLQVTILRATRVVPVRYGAFEVE